MKHNHERVNKHCIFFFCVRLLCKVNTVAPGTTGSIKISNGNCQTVDTWGSNNCDFTYGSTLGISFNLSFSFSVDAMSTITISGKITAGPFLSKDISYKCAACGTPCNIDPPSPFSSFGISFPTPACPFTTWNDSFNFPVPSIPDIPFAPDIDFTGSVSLTDPEGNVQDEVGLTVSASA
eukprot:m.1271926 g.1271926  ORF g.1271926 m.1271926 type:complete len:179 (-) comp24750_c0_seq60:3399-3935(-)